MNKPESVGRSPASLSYRASWRIFEQFEQIAQCPTWSGDLISISMAARLRKAGLIRRKNPPVRNAGNDCWRMGGYVLTWRGRLIWWLWQRVGG